jgi:hypothetical protein
MKRNRATNTHIVAVTDISLVTFLADVTQGETYRGL